MSAFRFQCTCCGQEHDGLPDLGYEAPSYFYGIPEAEREERTVHSADFCVIDGESYFIRGVLQVPVMGSDYRFGWGVWVSLSEPNFRRYFELFHEDPPPDEGPYFGWLSSLLPGYPDTLSLKACVHLRPEQQRPLIELEPSDHLLSIHQHEGIALDDLLEFVGPYLHGHADPGHA